MLDRTQISALVMDVTGMTVPDFQALLAARAEAAADWIVRGFEACGGQGVPAYYSRLHHPLRGWAPPCAESTGRLIPPLLRYSRLAHKPELAALAATQTRWLLSIQSLDSSFASDPGRHAEPSVFATGQIVLALVAAFDQTSDADFLQAAAGSARWLCDELSEEAGSWQEPPTSSFQPARHTQVCHAMLEVWQRTGEQRIADRAVRALNAIAGRRLPEGTVENWGLRFENPAFTDTIADTLLGLRQCGRILGEKGRRYQEIAEGMSELIRRQAPESGRLAGAFDPHMHADDSFTCLPGNCRFAQIWVERVQTTEDVECFRTALRTLRFVLDRQRTRSPGGRLRGALPGSNPLWGSYWPLKYPVTSAGALMESAMQMRTFIQRCSAAPTEP